MVRGMTANTAPALALALLIGTAGAPQAGEVSVDRASVRKICQVTGEVDRSTGQPTLNATQSRYRFWGTDLGASFEHDGRLIYLFGDTHGSAGRPADADLVAVSDDRDPEDCLKIDVLADADGGYRPLTVPGVDGGGFSVPTTGFSGGGALYLVATTDKTPAGVMGRSVLARSTNGGRDFERLYDLSRRHFINASAAPATADTAGALPPGVERGILLWGSGAYRASDVRLAVLPEDRADDRSALRYFAGLDAAGAPRWSAREEDARPLLDQACVGELSVAWNPLLRKWMMLYNCGAPRSQILLRTADRAWGPWSAPQLLFDGPRDGWCRFMHDGAGGCPWLSDPHSPTVAGDPYAPSLIASLTRGAAGSRSDVYFLMSTWNPYAVVLMKATLRLEPPVS